MKNIETANVEIQNLVVRRKQIRNMLLTRESNRLLDAVDKELARKTGFPLCIIGDVFR